MISQVSWNLRYFHIINSAWILKNDWPKPINLVINTFKVALILQFHLTWSGSPYTESNPVFHLILRSFATNLLEGGYDIRIVQELFGHNDVKTEMIYTHVLNRGGKGVKSPADDL